MVSRRSFLQHIATASLIAPALACDPREYARKHGATLRLSIAAGNLGGVYYVYAGAISAVITAHVPNVAATAEATGGTMDNMQFIQHGTADLAFATADVLDDAVNGTGVFSKIGRIPIRALAVLYDNYVHVATLDETGITTLEGLRGTVVNVGAAGSSTEVIAVRLMRAAGLDTDRDVRKQGLGVGPAVDALRDGKLDALIWTGGLPTSAILDLASTQGRKLVLIPCAGVLPELRRTYPAAQYIERTIPRGSYKGIVQDVSVVACPNVFVADAGMSDDLAYELTRALFDHQRDLAAVHAEARHLTVERAIDGSPIPFHAGAVRYYAERGVWKS